MPMNEAERKLEDYRNRKKREELLNRYKADLKTMFTFLISEKQKNQDNAAEPENSENLKPSTEEFNDDYLSDLDEEETSPLTYLDYLHYFLYFVLWATIYGIFIKLEFGMVYLILSGLIGMYLNTRTRPKMYNEVSAYSVFNRNCESIDGTLDAERLTKEMMYGGLAR